MLVSHFEHLRAEEGADLEEAVRRGSIERLSPILMTALCAGLALVPLVLAGSEPGNEIQSRFSAAWPPRPRSTSSWCPRCIG